MSDHIPLSQLAMGANRARTDYLDGLNPEQKKAVETVDGPLLVLAGAGTGKTRVLTTRLAHIIQTGRAKPWQCLCVTFTNKAAREMRERALNLIGPDGEGLSWLGTFHSISSKILRKHAELVGLKSTFTIIDTDDQIRLCKQIIEAENIDPKRWTPRYLAGLIDGWKNRALLPDKVPSDEAYQFADGKGIDLYTIYQSRLSVLNACDFGDLLLLTIKLFQENADVLGEYHNRFRYILVDEYQDTNIAQYLWLRLLARGTGNICCVGDDDQSIYGWRGAEVTNILKFEQDFEGSDVIRLERNYRSTGHILAAASHLITSNQGRLGKTLWTEDDMGEQVKLRGLWDGEAEARLIGDDIESWRSSGRRYDECAVLVRASWQMRAFEERFIMLGIPYRVIGGPRFFERAEIRDAMAYLRLIRSEDDDLAFERVVNQPKRGVGAKAFQTLQQQAANPPKRVRGYDEDLAIDVDTGEILTDLFDESPGPQRITLFEAARYVISEKQVSKGALTGLKTFIDQIKFWKERAKSGMSHTELAEQILDESGYTDMLRADRSPQAATRLDNLKELVAAMGQFDSLNAFLEHVELVMDTTRDSGNEDEVQILTLHAAKGLEWPLVFLPGWEEEVFPSKRSVDENGNKGLEEERRLAYVGITRARESCRISFVANRMIYGRWTSVIPSRFIDELPHENVEAISETGYGSRQGFSENFASAETSFEDLGQSSTYSSPGWKRMRETTRKRSAPPTIDGKAELLASSDPGRADFNIGQRVFHIKFGYGKVEQIEGAKLTVDFEKAGTKKVIGTFLEAA